MTRAPLYLRPASYRRRRRRDAARLLPFVGMFLFLLPVLWGPARGLLHDTAQDGIFLFIAWAAMIVLAYAIARSLRGHDTGGGDPETDPALDPMPDARPAPSGAPPRTG